MRTLFKEKHLQQAFDEKGYVIIRAAVPDEKIDALSAFYHKKATIPEDIPLILAMVDTTIPFHNKKFQQDLTSCYQTNIGTIIEDLVIDYRIAYESMSFVNKRPNQEILSIHKHPFYVDIRQHTALVVWVPMMDVDKKNGTLQMLPNTFSDYLFEFNTSELKERSEAAIMKKGDILIMNNTLQHWSDTNFTDTDRLSLAFPMLPNNVKMVSHIAKNKDGNIVIDMYEYDDTHTYFASDKSLKTKTPLESFVYKKAKPLATTSIQESVITKEQNLSLNKAEESLKTGIIYSLWRKFPANLRKRFFDITRG